MELRIDFTNPPHNVPIAEQPFSSLSQPVLTTPFHQLNSIHEEARCPPSRIADITVNKTSSCSFSTGAIIGTFCFHCERNSWFCCIEVRSQAIECFDYVWCASKMAVCRWEDMVGSTESKSFLRAVRYPCTTLPVFIKWEKRERFEVVKHVIFLTSVKNCQPRPSSIRKL